MIYFAPNGEYGIITKIILHWALNKSSHRANCTGWLFVFYLFIIVFRTLGGFSVHDHPEFMHTVHAFTQTCSHILIFCGAISGAMIQNAVKTQGKWTPGRGDCLSLASHRPCFLIV